jgi:hypothetical protein
MKILLLSDARSQVAARFQLPSAFLPHGRSPSRHPGPFASLVLGPWAGDARAGESNGPELPQPLFQVAKPRLDEGLHLATRVGHAVLELEEPSHVVEGEAVRLRRPYEAEPLKRPFGVGSVIARRSGAPEGASR